MKGRAGAARSGRQKSHRSNRRGSKMTLAQGLFVAAILAFIALGLPAAAVSMTRPAIANFVRRHIRTFYLTQAAVWVSFTVIALIGQSRSRGWMVAIGVASAALSIAMYALHPATQDKLTAVKGSVTRKPSNKVLESENNVDGT